MLRIDYGCPDTCIWNSDLYFEEEFEMQWLHSNERSIVGDIEAYFQSFDHHLVIIDESSELFRRKDIGHILKKSNIILYLLAEQLAGYLSV